MGFGREASRVRDPSLPYAYRLHALGSCIQIAQPIGFHATWSYLEVKVGHGWRRPEFLLPAMDLLHIERALHLRVEAEYRRLRREQKNAGYRYPPRADVTPSSPPRWHGDDSNGARHALQSYRNRQQDLHVASHPHGSVVFAVVDRALGRPAAKLDRADELQRALEWARRQIHVVGWESNPSEYRVAWVVHYLLGQLHLVANGATPIATPWDFICD